jgi:hypothetical protein
MLITAQTLRIPTSAGVGDHLVRLNGSDFFGASAQVTSLGAFRPGLDVFFAQDSEVGGMLNLAVMHGLAARVAVASARLAPSRTWAIVVRASRIEVELAEDLSTAELSDAVWVLRSVLENA